MMDDKDFYAALVKRLPSTIRTKTNLEMIDIVLRNTPKKVENMFDEKGIYELLEKNNNNSLAQAYNFIRDNQHLYVNPKYMNIEQVNEILENPKVLQFLKTNHFCDEDSKLILNQAIYRVNTDVIKHFMEKGIKPSTDTAFFIDHLVKNHNYLGLLEYIASKDVDLLKICSGSLILTATMNNNIKCLEYLIKDAPIDMHIIKASFVKYIGQEYEWVNNNMAGKKFEEVCPKILPIIHLLMPKISNKQFDSILENIKKPEMKEFLASQYLVWDLQNQLEQNPSRTTRIKI